MINSIGQIQDTNVWFPKFVGTRIYMAEVTGHTYHNSIPQEYHETVESMLAVAPNLDWDAKIFITIDEKHLTPNKKHRRGGVHVDGNFIYSWGGGGGWLNGAPGPVLRPEQHKLQYGSEKGGVIMASNYAACQIYLGKLDGDPGQGGSVEHLRDSLSGLESFLLPSHATFIGNSQMIHEGLTVQEEVDRQLVRITLNPEYSLETP